MLHHETGGIGTVIFLCLGEAPEVGGDHVGILCGPDDNDQRRQHGTQNVHGNACPGHHSKGPGEAQSGSDERDQCGEEAAEKEEDGQGKHQSRQGRQ